MRDSAEEKKTSVFPQPPALGTDPPTRSSHPSPHRFLLPRLQRPRVHPAPGPRPVQSRGRDLRTVGCGGPTGGRGQRAGRVAAPGRSVRPVPPPAAVDHGGGGRGRAEVREKECGVRAERGRERAGPVTAAGAKGFRERGGQSRERGCTTPTAAARRHASCLPVPRRPPCSSTNAGHRPRPRHGPTCPWSSPRCWAPCWTAWPPRCVRGLQIARPSTPRIG